MNTKLKKILMECLNEGGRIIRKGYGKAHKIRKKNPVSLVTEIDMESDLRVRRMIQRSFPDHRILTEELNPVESVSSYRWIIDPLDGTTNYAHGIPFFGISIGLEYKGEMVLGGIYNPVLNELFYAEKGKGAFMNGKRIRVSKTNSLIDSLVVTGFPYDRREKAGYYLKFIQPFIEKTRGIRRLGAAAIDLAYVACGKFEGYWEFNLKPWDMAAGLLIVQEAGGKVTDFKGDPIQASRPNQLLSSNGKIHDLLLDVLKNVVDGDPGHVFF